MMSAVPISFQVRSSFRQTKLLSVCAAMAYGGAKTEGYWPRSLILCDTSVPSLFARKSHRPITSPTSHLFSMIHFQSFRSEEKVSSHAVKTCDPASTPCGDQSRSTLAFFSAGTATTINPSGPKGMSWYTLTRMRSADAATDHELPDLGLLGDILGSDHLSKTSRLSIIPSQP
jgi:hypothetical protein